MTACGAVPPVPAFRAPDDVERDCPGSMKVYPDWCVRDDGGRVIRTRVQRVVGGRCRRWEAVASPSVIRYASRMAHPKGGGRVPRKAPRGQEHPSLLGVCKCIIVSGDDGSSRIEGCVCACYLHVR